MSSFTRRIQRTTSPSRAVHPTLDSEGKFTGKYHANPPRMKGYMGRGSKLGVTNLQAADLLARSAREEKRRAAHV